MLLNFEFGEDDVGWCVVKRLGFSLVTKILRFLYVINSFFIISEKLADKLICFLIKPIFGLEIEHHRQESSEAIEE